MSAMYAKKAGERKGHTTHFLFIFIFLLSAFLLVLSDFLLYIFLPFCSSFLPFLFFLLFCTDSVNCLHQGVFSSDAKASDFTTPEHPLARIKIKAPPSCFFID